MLLILLTFLYRNSSVFCLHRFSVYLCLMNKDIQQLLSQIAVMVNLTEDVRAILDKLIKQAKEGDTDAVKQLREIVQKAKEEQLRKDLFGV